MADDRLREYYDAQQPSEALMERLRAMEAPPKKPRRYAFPLAAAALITLVLIAGIWSRSANDIHPVEDDFGLPGGDQLAEDIGFPGEGAQGSDLPGVGSDSPGSESESNPTGEAEYEGEYRLENGRHMVYLNNAAGAHTFVDLTDSIVDRHYEGEVLVGKEYVHIALTILEDGSAELTIGSRKGETR